jgi:membrane protein
LRPPSDPDTPSVRTSRQRLRLCYGIAKDSIERFNADDGWAISSHLALSTLMAMFPFLIVLAGLAGFVTSLNVADAVVTLMLKTWPSEVSGPIAADIREVLRTARGGVLWTGIAFAVFFSSSGIESLRIGLNRAYQVEERRSWLKLRVESIAYVVVGAIVLVALGFLIVLAPLIFGTALAAFPKLAAMETELTLARYAVATLLLVAALVLVHKWLPAGRRRFAEIAPGVLVTLLLWLVGGAVLGRYLADFAHTFVTYYAGLASGMIALSFLYLTAAAFVYGGELNASVERAREAARRSGNVDPEDALVP